MRLHSYILDGDNIRKGLNKDLGFLQKDRKENIRRISEVVKLFIDAGILVLTAFISPYKKDTDKVRKKLKKGKFIEIYVDCSLKTCEKRDSKGFYKKAKLNEIIGFTGISAPYEKPDSPELVLINEKNKDIRANAKKELLYL